MTCGTTTKLGGPPPMTVTTPYAKNAQYPGVNPDQWTREAEATAKRFTIETNITSYTRGRVFGFYVHGEAPNGATAHVVATPLGKAGPLLGGPMLVSALHPVNRCAVLGGEEQALHWTRVLGLFWPGMPALGVPAKDLTVLTMTIGWALDLPVAVPHRKRG